MMEFNRGQNDASFRAWALMTDKEPGEGVYDLSFAYKINWDHPETDIKEALHLLLCASLVSDRLPVEHKVEEHAKEPPGLSAQESARICWLIVLNPNTPPPVLDSIVNKECTPMVLERIAEHPRTRPSTLARLAFHPNPDVRAALADNINTPAETIEILLKDEHPDVRYRIAESYHMPLSVLRQLTEDDNPYVAQRAQRTLGRINSGGVVSANFRRESTTRKTASYGNS